MLEDMFKVMDRINEIKKRFSINKLPIKPFNHENKNFKDTLNQEINKQSKNEAQKPELKIKEPGIIKNAGVSNQISTDDNISENINTIKKLNGTTDYVKKVIDAYIDNLK